MIECHNCEKEFPAQEWEEGACPYCQTRYKWYQDGDTWSDMEAAIPIFETESKSIQELFLISPFC